jgi:hypothetical protein
MGGFAVDLDAPGGDPFLDLAARAETGIGERLLQLDARRSLDRSVAR